MTTDVVLFPDAAAVAIDYLRAELADRATDIPVVKDVPKPRPAVFVTVRRGGGVRQTVVSDNPILLVECWGDPDSGTGDEQAQDVAQLCRALLFAMAGTVQSGTAVYRVGEVAGPNDLPDPLSEQPRVVFTVQVHLRGSAEQSAS